MVIATQLSIPLPPPAPTTTSRSQLAARAMARPQGVPPAAVRASTLALARSNPVAAQLGTTPRCPCCQTSAASALPICYGMVAPSVVEQARRGEVVLGPVNHGRNEPRLACQRCQTRYGAPRADLDRFGRPLQPRQAPTPPSPPAQEAAARRAELLEVLPLRRVA